jgi:hypothetical protein
VRACERRQEGRKEGRKRKRREGEGDGGGEKREESRRRRRERTVKKRKEGVEGIAGKPLFVSVSRERDRDKKLNEPAFLRRRALRAALRKSFSRAIVPAARRESFAFTARCPHCSSSARNRWRE